MDDPLDIPVDEAQSRNRADEAQPMEASTGQGVEAVTPEEWPLTGAGGDAATPEEWPLTGTDADNATPDEWPETGFGQDGSANPRWSAFPVVPGFKVLHELGHGGMGVVYKASPLNMTSVSVSWMGVTT